MRISLAVASLVLVSACATEEKERLESVARQLDNQQLEYEALLANLEERRLELRQLKAELDALSRESSFASLRQTLQEIPYVAEVHPVEAEREGVVELRLHLNESAPALEDVLTELEDTLPPADLKSLSRGADGWRVEVIVADVRKIAEGKTVFDFRPKPYAPPRLPAPGPWTPGIGELRHRVREGIARVEKTHRLFDEQGAGEVRSLSAVKDAVKLMHTTRTHLSEDLVVNQPDAVKKALAASSAR